MAIVRTDLVPWGELNALLRRLNIGLLLFLALAAWGLLSHPTAPGGPAFAAALLVGALGWAAGVLVARVDPTLPGIAVAGLAVLVLGLGLPGSVSGDAAPGPMGYANANAALLTAAVAGLLGAARGCAPARRHLFLASAGTLTLLAFATGSRASAASCVVLLVGWVLLPRGRDWQWQAASGAVIVGLLSLTVYLGLSHSPDRDGGSQVASDAIGDTRERLWSDALQESSTGPVTGSVPAGSPSTALSPGAIPTCAGPTARLCRCWPSSAGSASDSC